MRKSCFAAVPLSLLTLLAAASAAPKAMHSAKPLPPVHPPVSGLHPRPYLPPRPFSGSMPNMTRMPDSHLVSAFCLAAPGEQLYTDVSGRVIGRGSPAAPGGIIWLHGKLYRPSVQYTPLSLDDLFSLDDLYRQPVVPRPKP